MTDDAWIELRRFDDPLEAEMTRAFLEEHGIQVAYRGNAGATNLLSRFTTGVDIRLVVPATSLVEAREALDALVPETTELPFRGRTPSPLRAEAPRRASTEAPSGPRPRNVLAVLVASSVLPIAAAHLAQGCRGEVVVRRRAAPDFALAPAAAEEALPPGFASGPAIGPTFR